MKKSFVEEELEKEKKKKKVDDRLINNLEKKLVEIKAKVLVVGEDAEDVLTKNDKILRSKLPETNNQSN